MQNVLSKTADILAAIRWWILAFLIGLAPFHAFLITWLKSAGFFALGANLSALFLISAWREIFVVLICLLIFAEFFIKYSSPLLPTACLPDRQGQAGTPHPSPLLNSLDFLILLYSALALIWLFIQPDKMQWLWGFRYDILPFLFLFFVRRANWKKVSWLIRAALVSAAVVLVFGLLQSTILPQNFLENFGYAPYSGEYTPETGIAACQYLEHTQTVCRAVSFFGGPTRYGTYLLLVIGLLLPFVIASPLSLRVQAKQSRFVILACLPDRRAKAGIYTLLALALLNIFLTYSRSIWIGTSVAAFITFFIKVVPTFAPLSRDINCLASLRLGLLASRAKCSLRTVGIGIIAIFTAIFIAGTALVFSNIDLKTVLVRASSTSAHLQLLKEGTQKLITQPFGYGLGTAGPASLHFEKFLPENWFLQIGLEMGIAGLILFLGILFLIFRNLLKSARADTACQSESVEGRLNVGLSPSRTGLFFALVGIAIAGLFTHSFEETTTMLILFGFIGIFSNLQVKTAIDKI